jgi:ribosomal protein S18 acetylase RimI-like enzyme
MDAASTLVPVFRRATPEDIPVIRELADRIWRVSYRDMISLAQIEHMLGWMYSAATLAREIGEGIRYDLAEREGCPVGYLALSVHADGYRAELHKLYLLPELQGQGVGQAMLRHAQAVAVAAGARRLELRVNRHNLRAQRAYLRAGFQIAGEVCQDIGGGFAMDDFVMARECTA